MSKEEQKRLFQDWALIDSHRIALEAAKRVLEKVLARPIKEELDFWYQDPLKANLRRVAEELKETQAKAERAWYLLEVHAKQKKYS